MDRLSLVASSLCCNTNHEKSVSTNNKNNKQQVAINKAQVKRKELNNHNNNNNCYYCSSSCNKKHANWQTRSREIKIKSSVGERRRIRDRRKEKLQSSHDDKHSASHHLLLSTTSTSITFNYLLLAVLLLILHNLPTLAQQAQQPQQPLTAASALKRLPDLTSATSDEPIVAIVGQDAFISCVAKNLQNYTIIWRYTNEASAPGVISNGAAAVSDNKQALSSSSSASDSAQPTSAGLESGELGTILTAGRQRVIADDRFSVIQSHDTWLLKVSNVRLSDTGTYICHTNSEPKVRVLRILSVIRPANVAGSTRVAGQEVDAIGK